MWRQFRHAELRSVLYNNMPDHAIRDETAPGLSGSTDTPKYLPTAYASHHEPLIINGFAGVPKAAVAGKACSCRGCEAAIIKGEKCFDVPNPREAFSNSRRFCVACRETGRQPLLPGPLGLPDTIVC